MKMFPYLRDMESMKNIVRVIMERLRDDIIKDVGHPKLRKKCLDLITKLRVEANVLNREKTARISEAEEAKKAPPQLRNVKEFDENFKEKLGLDAEGMIKVSHGVEEIKEMLEKGMVRTFNNKKTAT